MSEIAQWKFTPGAITQQQLMVDYTAEVQPKGKARRPSLTELIGVEPEYLAAALLGVEPKKLFVGIGVFDRGAAAPDLAEQAPTLVEMPARLIQNPRDHGKPVASSVESQFRLVPAFGGSEAMPSSSTYGGLAMMRS